MGKYPHVRPGAATLQAIEKRLFLTSRYYRQFFPFAVSSLSPETDDVELLRRIAERDGAAFASVYDRYSPLVYSIAMRILADPAEASDVLQEVFLSLHKNAKNFDPRLGRPVAWLSTMARNRSLDHLKRIQRGRDCAEKIRLEQTEPDFTGGSGVTAVYHDEVQIIHKAVADLPQEQRQALELAYFSGLTQQEISEQLAQPLGTVKARIRRGLFKLREALDGLI